MQYQLLHSIFNDFFPPIKRQFASKADICITVTRRDLFHIEGLGGLRSVCQLSYGNTRISFLKKISNFLIFLIAENGFKMWQCAPSTAVCWFCLGWHFLRSSLYSAVFRVCDTDSIDNSPVFYLLLNIWRHAQQ